MGNVALPKFLNPDNLFLYCELTAYNDNGSKVDFTGLKTYSIEFMKDNLGFGITNIDIDISPSLQPIIEVTFKDFYGNLAFGFSEHKKNVQEALGNQNVDDLDFSSMFDLPYPKFKLTLKGFLGHPIILELNVKKINVTLVPNDGSYEIKALFVPNLYGFFADMPYYFLKAVKSLRLDGANASEKQFIEQNYISTWDIALLGEEIQEEIQTIEDSFGDLKVLMESILNGSDKMFEIDWFKSPAIEGKTNSSFVSDFKNIYFNIQPLVNGQANLDMSNSSTGANVRYGLKNNTGSSNGVSNKEIMRRALLASISTTPQTKKINILTPPQDSDVNRGTEIIKKNLEALENFRNSQLKKGKETKIKQVTIKNIFDLIIKDSAFLMGKILEAGQKGFNLDQSRLNSKNKFGNYFPLIQDPNTQEQKPDITSYEYQFVSKFVKALTEGIVSDLNKGNDNTPGNTLNTNNTVSKRINNLEVFSTNSFDTNSVDTFIETMLLRSGIAVSMLDESSGISYELKLKFWQSFSSKFDALIKSEIENADAGIKKLSNGSNKFSLLNFCDFIKKIINTKGELLDDKGNVVNLSQPISQTLNEPYTFPGSTNTIPLRDILSKYLPSRTGVDANTFKSKVVYYNNLPFFNRVSLNSDILYVLFKNDTTTPGAANLTQANNANTQAFESDRFLIEKITDINDDINMGAETDKSLVDLIGDKRILDFDKIKKGVGLNSSSITNGKADIYFTGVTVSDPNFTLLEQKIKSEEYYVGLLSTGGNEYVWNLFGKDLVNDDDVWVNQRKYLRLICDAIKTKVNANTDENNKKIEDTISKVSSQNDVLYTQFHHLCNNWKNLLSEGLSTSSNIALGLEKIYTDTNQVKYEIPLQTVQKQKGEVINLEDAIVNPQPLTDTNSQTTVLNVMSNICHLNNFMFLSIPGNGNRDDNIQEIFSPYTLPVKSDSIKPNNFFYVLFMPTPENRVAYNNRDPLYQTFNADLAKDVFEIDFGSSYNTIVKSIGLTTEDSRVTAESAIAISNLVDGNNSRRAKNLDCSALSIMEGRSYKLNGEMIGNAQITPTQFFVINRAPVFNGLYQIMRVKHRISNMNIMTTSFEAIKMKFAGNNSDFVFIPPITLKDLGVTNTSPKNLPNQIAPTQSGNENFAAKDIKNSIKPQQEKFLNNLHPDVQDQFRGFINTIQDKTDYVVIITSGYRTFAEQAELKKQNNKNAEPGLSYHNYGMALDINLQNGNKILRKNSPTSEWKSSGALAIADEFNLRWGGYFAGYDDRVHFDAGKQYNTSDLLRKAKLQYGTNLNNIQGNRVQLA